MNEIDEEALRESVRAKRSPRSNLLIAIYVATDATPVPHGRVTIPGLASDHGWNEDEVTREVLVLKDSGHIDVAAGNRVGLTAYGIQAVEQAIEPQEDPMEPIDAIELRKVEAFVRDLRTSVDAGKLPADGADTQELQDLLGTLETQLHGRGRRRIHPSGPARHRRPAHGCGRQLRHGARKANPETSVTLWCHRVRAMARIRRNVGGMADEPIVDVDDDRLLRELKRLSKSGELGRITAFKGYRERPDGGIVEVTVEIRDSGEAGPHRWSVKATDEEGRMAAGNPAARLDVALTLVHWYDLDRAR